jgi:hypothetical protein
MVEGLISLFSLRLDAFPLSIALERLTIERFMLARVVAAAVVSRSANVLHDSRVHLIAPLPSLIHCSHVPRSAGRDRLVTMKPTRG